jgi:hypothetical protein
MLPACKHLARKRLQMQGVVTWPIPALDINSYHLYQRLSPVLDTMDTKEHGTWRHLAHSLLPQRDPSAHDEAAIHRD